MTGRGSAWLERLVRDQEVPGSNPGAPTIRLPVSGDTEKVAYGGCVRRRLSTLNRPIHGGGPSLRCKVKEKKKASEQKRIHVFYSGRVQGVGFRFTTEKTALSLRIAGWVKNLPDGRVEVVAEGEEATLVLFIEKMKNGPMQPYIRSASVEWHRPKGEFNDFCVRF